MKKFLAISAWVLAGLSSYISSTFADVYTLSGTDVASLWGAANDTATSLVWVLASLLPVFIPLIVVGFVIALIRWFMSKRG